MRVIGGNDHGDLRGRHASPSSAPRPSAATPAPVQSADPATAPTRSPEQIAQHYRIEKELAARLRAAGGDARRVLYAKLYDELFRRVPHHPQLLRKRDPAVQAERVRTQLRLLGRFLRPEATFLEVGPGDCALAVAVAERVRKVYVADVSQEITRGVTAPPNVELAISGAWSLPLKDALVDVAYSDQLVEHLHPEDALAHLRAVRRVLVPGGLYLCITPSRLSGPHDISKYFDEVASGFHLKEYTATELAHLFRAAGFTRVRVLLGRGETYVPVPVGFLAPCELLLERASRRLRMAVTSRVALGWLQNIHVLARAGAADGPRRGA